MDDNRPLVCSLLPLLTLPCLYTVYRVPLSLEKASKVPGRHLVEHAVDDDPRLSHQITVLQGRIAEKRQGKQVPFLAWVVRLMIPEVDGPNYGVSE